MNIDWTAGSGYLQAGGKSLEWASFGASPSFAKGGSPIIVLLHEGLGCVALWRDFPQALSEATGLPVFAYSRAGYGQSDAAELPRPVDYMTREAIDVLPEVLAQLGQGPVILLGHSDGATIAAEYAGRVSDQRVRGLVLMAPHFFTEPMGLAEIAAAKEVFVSQDLKTRMAKYHRDPASTFKGWNDAWLNPDFQRWNVGEVIDYFRIPCLVVQGKQDQYGTEAQVREVETRSYAPVETALLDDCRHAPFLEQPEATLAQVSAFLRRLQANEAAQVDQALQ